MTTATTASAPSTSDMASRASLLSLLRMAVGDEDLAVPIDDVREILEVGRLTTLPRTPSFVRGVMNLRGAVVPVIDLAARVGQNAITIGRRSCVVVVDHGGGPAGGRGL
jgi:purine-binding chemotaxis protein CheW